MTLVSKGAIFHFHDYGRKGRLFGGIFHQPGVGHHFLAISWALLLKPQVDPCCRKVEIKVHHVDVEHLLFLIQFNPSPK